MQCFPNSKPWINPDIKALLKEKRGPLGSGNKEEVKAVQKELRKKIKEGKIHEEDGGPVAAEKHQWSLGKP